MRRFALAAAFAATTVGSLSSSAHAAPVQYDDEGVYLDDLADGTGLASFANASLDGDGGWVALVSPGTPGSFTTKDIDPSALSSWGKVYLRGSGQLSLEVLAGGSPIASPALVASDDPAYTRMASLAAVPPTTQPIQLRVTFSANGPAAPIVDALRVTWTSVSTLKLAAQGPAALCSGATGLWKFPLSISNVTARQTVVTVELPLGATPDGFSDAGTRLRFVSATHGGVYHPGPDPIIVDGVTVLAHHVYWRLGDLRFGSTFPLGLSASIPNGTLGNTTYQLTADADASNAAQTSATAAPTPTSATPALSITKALTGVYRIGTKWRAPAGATVGYTLTVRNDFAPTCRATAQRVVVWDPLQIATSPGNAYPYAAAPTFLSAGLQHTVSQRDLHDADTAGHTITVPANAVYAQIPALAPGASATFEVRLPLSTDLVFDDHVVNVAHADSGYLPHAAQRSAQADFYAGIDYTPFGDYAKGDAIRGVSNVTALQDNANLTVGYGEYFKFLLSATNAGASVLRDTTMFDKLPLDLVELVDVHVPPASGATVYYYSAASAGADNPATAPPGYDPATGALSGWTTTRPSDAAWVAIKVPRIGSKVYDATNGTSPLRVTAEIGVRTRLPDANAACAVTGIDNVGFFHTVSYEDALGELQPTNHSGTSNTENVTIVPMTPSFSTSYALATPALAFGSGPVTYSLRLTNTIANNPGQTDDAENVVVRVDVPKTFIAGSHQALDILDVKSAGGSVDYTNLPDYLLVRYDSFAANTSRTVEIDAYVPKGVVDGATARLSATIAAQDVDDICDVADKSVAATVSFSVSPFLQVDKRLDFAVAGRGKTVTYTLRALNSGEGAALDTVITDRLPAALDFVRAPVPPNGMTLWFSEADVPAMPLDVRDPDGDFTESFVLTSGLFAPGLVSGGYVTSPFAKPTWIAVLVDDPSLTPPQLPATGVPQEVHLEMVVPAGAADALVIANEANIAAAGLLPAVSNRPLLLVSDDPALELSGTCPGAIASGERLHLVETFTNNSTNPNTTTTARIAIPTHLVTPSAVTITSAEGTFVVPLPAGDASHFVSTNLVGTTRTVSWNVTADLGRALAPGESVKMDLDFVAGALPTGTPIPFNVTGTATRDVVGTATVNVGTQCTIYVANPDLAIAKLVDRDTAVAGDALTYTLVVENRGPHDASNVIVREALPAGLAIVPGSVRVSPSAWTIAGASDDPAFIGGSDPENGGAVYEWSRAQGNALTGPSGTPGLLPGLSPRVYISFRVNVVSAAAGTTIDNCARAVLGPEVASGDQLADETPADNLDCVPTRVPNPDPKIVKTGPATVQQGQTFAYTLRWWNASRQPAENVVLFERIPNLDAPANGDPDLTVQGVIAPAGVGVYYAATPNPSTDPLAHPAFSIGAPTSGDWRASLAEVGGKPTWIAFVIGALPGESTAATATINVVAADPDSGADTPAGAEIVNCATIEMNGGATDDNEGNNVSCIPTRVPGLNVALEKTCDPEGFYPGARPGDATSFTLVLANRGTSNAFGIRVDDPLPAWFDFAGFSPAAAELVDQDGAAASFVTPSGDAIVGAVAWTRVGDTFYLGSPDPAHPTYYRDVGLPRGAKTTLTLTGLVDQDTAAETLASNTATITTDRTLDSDPAEAADLLFDNSDSCELMVHRPDPLVEKRAEIAGSTSTTVGAGDLIDYTIGYDNVGLATASDVVIEDVFPDGVSWVVGSLVDVPVGATVEYYDGSTWTTTAPSGAAGTVDPNVKGVRVSFSELTAPLDGGYTQKGATAFSRGTYDGTIFSEELQAIIVDPAFSGDGTPTYTSPAIPVDDGALLEWISLLVGAADSGAPRPTVDVLDAGTGAVLLTTDPAEPATDLRGIDPALHPSIELRASFTPGAGGGPDYSGGFVALPSIGEGKPMSGSAHMTAGDFVAGIVRKDTFSPGQPAMWRRFGGIYERVELGDEGLGAQNILYLDDDYMVVQGSEVVVWHRDDATDTWTATALGSAYELAIARLGGDNAALCGADRSCLFIALAMRTGLSEIAYHGPDGWMTAFSQNLGFNSVNSVNTLGYVMFGSPYNGQQQIVRPTGDGWAAVTMPTLPEISFWNKAMLSSDSADALVATSHSVNPRFGVYQLHPSADPNVWTYTELGRGSSAQLNYGGPDGSFSGYLGANYFWRRSGTSFPSYLTSAPAGGSSPVVRVLGVDGVAAGDSSQSGTRPTFWSFTGAGYEASNIQTAYWDSVTGQVFGLDASATLAYGSNNTVLGQDIVYVRTGDTAPWGWDPWLVGPGAGFDDARVIGAGALGWVGMTGDYQVSIPVVWERDALVPGTDIEPILLETPLVQSGIVLAGASGGCMLGEIDTLLAQWIPNGDGTFEPAFFTSWGAFSDITYSADLPGGRIFGYAYDADDNSFAVELVCHANGFHLEIMPGPNGVPPAEVSYADGGVLFGYDADYNDIFWLPTATGETLLFTASEARSSRLVNALQNGENFYGADYWDFVPFATYRVPDGDDDFSFQYLDMPPGAQYGGEVVHHSEDGRLVGVAWGASDTYTVVWSQAAPTEPWSMTGSATGYSPYYIVGRGTDAVAIGEDSSGNPAYITLDPVAGAPLPDVYPEYYGADELTPAVRAALADGILPVYSVAVAGPALVVYRGGNWIETAFGEDQGFDGYAFLGRAKPGVYLGVDANGVYVHALEPDGTVSTTPIDIGGFTPPYGIIAEELGDIADDGTFMMWMQSGDGEEGDGYTMVAFYPDATSASGYALNHLGLEGDAFADWYNDLSPGQYLGNGCWTAWELSSSGDGGDYINGYDPNGTTQLRVWGCPSEGGGGGDEALAAWSLAFRGDIRPSWSFQVQVDDVCQREIVNTAQISTTTPEIRADNNTASVTLPVATADLAVALQAPVTVIDAAVSPSTTVEVTIENRGPSTAKDIDLALVLPAGVTLDSGGQSAWSFTSLAVGERHTFTVPVTLGSDAANVTYTFAARAETPTIDCQTDNDAVALSLVTGEHPDLRVTKTGPATVRPFEDFAWQVGWFNDGNVVASGFTVTDTLPEVEIVDPGTGDYTGDAVLWIDQTLEPGVGATDEIIARLEGCALVGQTLTNLIAAPYAGDADPNDNEAAWTTTVLPALAAMEVEVVTSQAVDQDPGRFHVTAYYRNSGVGTVKDAGLTVTLPAGFTAHADSILAGGFYDAGQGKVSYGFGDLPTGALGSVTFVIEAAAPASGVITASPVGDNICPVDTSVAVTVADEPLAIAKTADVDNACTGDVVTWTITVSNPGASTLTGVTVQDLVPSGASYVAGSITGPGASALGAPSLTWNIGTLDPGEAVILTYQTTITTSDEVLVGAGPSWSTPIASGKGNETAVRIACDNALSLTKSVLSACVDGALTLTVTLTYANDGPADLSDVVISDYVGHLPIASTVPGALDEQVSFAVGTVGAGQSGSVSYTAILATGEGEAGQLLLNRAAITASDYQPQTSNQVATPVIVCEAVAECQVNADCDDHDACTTDICEAGSCVNTALVCDDGSACTTDSCDPASGCVYADIDCGDGSACTDDSCDPATGCVYEDLDCDDGSECTTDSCDPASGCVYDDVVCDDGSACTIDACDPATGCTASEIECDDGNACTTDTCDPATGCAYTTITCTDDDACTTDTCDPSTGCEFQPVTCNDNSACTEDSCDPATGCEFEAVDCDDGNACTADSCHPQTGCVHTPITCSDNDACTTDTCDPSIGCEYLPIVCDDQSLCTEDSCNAATGCVFDPITCDDGSECTTDSCDPATGCTTSPITCDDENACTDDACDDATGCTFTNIECDDQSMCTTDSCDPATGCVFTEISCADDSACTTDTCDPATGCVYDEVDCDDDNACTEDACNAETGCVYSEISCDDSDACTSEVCNPATGCVYDEVVCDDGSACTTDSCDPSEGCRSEALDCDDANACTTDACDDTTGCSNTAITCDDDDICTADSCDPASGCSYEPLPPRAVDCGAGACGGVVAGTETCIDGAWIDDCDEIPGGQIPDTGCDEVRVAYAIVNDAAGAPYGTIRCFQDLVDNVIGCETVAGSATELKIYEAFFCGVQE